MIGARDLLDSRPKWKATFAEEFFDSGTVTETGQTTIVATPNVTSGDEAVFPFLLQVVGTGLTADETASVSIDWYTSSAATDIIAGATAFTQLTASVPTASEGWPGDLTTFNAGKDMIPLPPFHRVRWTLAGGTISLDFIIKISYLKLSF